MSEFFHPKLQSVKALEPYRLSTVWSTGEVLEVDLAHVMRGSAFAEIKSRRCLARFTPMDQALSGLIQSLGQTMFMPGLKNNRMRSVTRCLVLGCTATSCRFPVLPTLWASVVAW